MPSVCFYFQVHQPYRLRRYSFFDLGKDHFYEDGEKNRAILNKVSDKCYLPANALMLELIKKYKRKFNISYSISGVALEQFEVYRPDVLKSFIELAKTGCVEFLSETYYHSLSFIFSKKEFQRQVQMHRLAIEKHFNQTPLIFRNTELIYNNSIASVAEKMGFKGILCEGVDRILGNRSPNFVYRAKGCKKIKVLPKNYRLSDDIAFRFSDRNWNEWPLHADTYASWIHKIAGNGQIINLFMDYETFGEHQWESTGIFDFMKYLPGEILKHQDFNFITPSEAIKKYKAQETFDSPAYTSWADAERDLSAWLSNNMEKEAIRRLYSLEKSVLATKDEDLIHTWGKLQTSDHFYYMCTKFWSDGDVHKYFSPYDSPYDAYIYYMNALSDFESSIKSRKAKPVKKSVKKTVAN
ncbi:MAG: glycoside hydrolase family 57 protein [Bacteroidia bacterium]|nr:polysaccharide deacetylase family protein [Bacteroidia bacterium]MCZ2276919.1 glycoside hydrolase family 57 protein [Bacteroidia bacterium]